MTSLLLSEFIIKDEAYEIHEAQWLNRIYVTIEMFVISKTEFITIRMVI